MLDVDGLISGEFNEEFEMGCTKCILNVTFAETTSSKVLGQNIS